MHSTFCFLTDKGESENQFNEMTNNDAFMLDDNNWYQLMCSVDKEGNVKSFCEESDWRGRNWLYVKLMELEPNKRWEYAVTIVNDCLLGAARYALTYLSRDSVNRFKDLQIQDIATTTRSALKEYAEKGNAYSIAECGRIVNQINYMNGPFCTNYSTPYDSLPTIAFTEREFNDSEVEILFVDIHS